MLKSGQTYSRLGVWDGGVSTGALHMAADEAMARCAPHPVLRWYRWSRPEITFGYPQRWRDVKPMATGRPAVRRWTGGGLVEHGSDLTIALAVPARDGGEAPSNFYERVHRAIAAALGGDVRLASGDETSRGVACFEHPACFDVLHGPRKIVGGALRRTCEGTLYQGSIQNAEIPPGFISRLAENLAETAIPWQPGERMHQLIAELLAQRYATPAWQTRR